MSGDRLGRSRLGSDGNLQEHSSGIVNPPVGGCQFSLRILVSRESVGAIIGRGGSTIRSITKETKARIDVNRKEYNSSDKAVTIYGTLESQSDACRRILNVMIEEATLTNSTQEVMLKILAHDDLVGRLIGKDGQNIKTIMKESNTKINVSSLSQLNGDNVDRVIAIQGTVQGMTMAGAMVSERLKKSYNDDLNLVSSKNPQHPTNDAESGTIPGRFGNNNNPAASSTRYEEEWRIRNPFVQWHMGPVESLTSLDWAGAYGAIDLLNEKESIRLIVSTAAVGSIIGRKGSSIRNIKWASGATIRVSTDEDGSKREEKSDDSTREIVITGYPQQQWKAQSLIFEKMKNDGLLPYDPRFTVEMTISNSKVGKLIGKRGETIKELMARTGARIVIENDTKCHRNAIPDVACSGLPSVRSSSSASVRGPTFAKCVRIIGSFNAIQLAQRHIRALVSVQLFRPSTNSTVVPTIYPAGALRLGLNPSCFPEPL